MIAYLRTCVGGWCLLAADALGAAADVLIPADPERNREHNPDARLNGRPHSHAPPENWHRALRNLPGG